MKKTVLLSGFLFAALLAQAQTSVIVLQRAGTSNFYYMPTTTFVDVLNLAMDNDTIYLPGGTIPYTGATIDKKLTIVGAGFHQNGVPVTQKTVLPTTTFGGFGIGSGASGSSFHGIDFECTMYFAVAEPGISFARCEFNNTDLQPTFGFGPTGVNFQQCVFRQGLYVGNSTSVYINNCIIEDGVDVTGTASDIRVNQCLVLGAATLNSTQVSGITYVNNIFTSSQSTLSVNSLGTFQNNLFATTNGPNVTYGSGSYTNNQETEFASAQFVSVSNVINYAYNFDYHTQSGSAADLMSGLGGYEIGIYGGSPGSGWAELGIPFNPHWELLVTPLNTVNGVLPGVQIQGSAQPN